MTTLDQFKERHSRWLELKSDWDYGLWEVALGHSVHFSSLDRQGNIVEGFYPPDEKLSSALIYRNYVRPTL